MTLTQTDIRSLFASAVDTARATIDNVRPDQLDGPTPCDQFTVRQLLGHLVDVLGRVAVVGRGGEPMAAPFGTADSTPDDGWTEAWLNAARDVQAAWTDDAALTRTVVLPWATQSGAEALAMWMNEVCVHTWDLAAATGQQPQWDEAVLNASFDAIRRLLPAENRAAGFEATRQAMPPAMRNFPPPFAEAVATADNAPLIDRLVAYNGRDPRRS